MRSPFPGMDPYLETPALWSSVHARLITLLSDGLADLVSPNFIVDIEQRIYVIGDDLVAVQVVPGHYVVSHPRREHLPVATGGVATTPAMLIEPLYPAEIRQRWIAIRDRQARRVVTTVEIVSPFNKEPSARGRDAF